MAKYKKTITILKLKERTSEAFEKALGKFIIKDKLSIANEASSVICALNPKNKDLVNSAYFEGKGSFKHKDCIIYFCLSDKVQENGFWLLHDNEGQGVLFEK